MIPGFVFIAALQPALEPEAPRTPLFVLPLVVTEPQAAAAPAEPKKDVWTGSVVVGATYQDGNTNTRGVNANFDAERRGDDDRWTAKGYWNYAEEREPSDDDPVTEENDGITTRKGGASLKYDYFLSKKTYVFGVAGWSTDTFADIRNRYYVGPGVGYQWREDEKLKWGSEFAVTYFREEYFDATDPSEEEYPALRIANNIAWTINEKTKIENTVEVFPSLEDSDDFYGKSDTKARTNLTEAMFAQLQWVYEFDNTPASGRARNDNSLILGVGWAF